MIRRLDRKLLSITAGRYTPDDFVLADAKDADMAFGVPSAGQVAGADLKSDTATAPGRYRSREDLLGDARTLVGHGLIDMLLLSASNGERLVADGSIDHDVTLAVRANDTTDIWLGRGNRYRELPSRPFRSVDLRAIAPFCDLVLYSLTFNNDLERDLATLESYRKFRLEAEALGIRHFLEIFNPNAPVALEPSDIGAFVNDAILRTLAGITTTQRPLFLKVAYNGAGGPSWSSTIRRSWWASSAGWPAPLAIPSSCCITSSRRVRGSRSSGARSSKPNHSLTSSGSCPGCCVVS